MIVQHKFSSLITRNGSHLQEVLTHLDAFWPAYSDDKLFSAPTDAGNAGNSSGRKQDEEIRDESGLGSGAGVTSDTDQDPSGATGPGSDRKGDKIPGEDGITKITDAIAKAIDRAEEDDDGDVNK